MSEVRHQAFAARPPISLTLWLGLIGASLLSGGWFASSWAADSVQRQSGLAGVKEEPKIDEQAVREKLEQIQANQQSLLQKFEALKEEVRIIKVRASSRGSITQ